MRSVGELEDALSDPSAALVADLASLPGDIVVLGAGGKLGPSLVRLACRAVAAAGTGVTVHAVSRFGDGALAYALAAAGAHAVPADLSDDAALAAVPDAPNVVFLVGAKFGTEGNEPYAWATNTYLPGRVAERFSRARIVAVSTGNVYPLVPVTSPGCVETDPVAPVGDYAMSCLGRERVLTHFSERNGTPMVLVRLNYAVEMRYGVLVDIAAKIAAGEPVDLTTGHANVVWQGYANEVVLRSLRHAATPPLVLNLTGPERVSVRDVATRLAERLGRPVTFSGTESGTALLSDARRCHEMFGPPAVGVDELVDRTAEWIRAESPLLGRPTHFETRDGRF